MFVVVCLITNYVTYIVFCFFFFSSRRRHTRCREVSWARRCVQETGINAEYMGILFAGIMSFIIIKIIRAFGNIRVSEIEEAEGLDINEHSESAYPAFNGMDQRGRRL
eukprot:TRINITY_DN8271_c0_g1_i3.p2 TRINITY_DN8271_c0_g1~~TRINITY_DN8271_c0_g1_i3.p2  ORF type:complete len:108 (-),score=40.57 TRINITY_DN8271_c0_g1_i3:442-765(-)